MKQAIAPRLACIGGLIMALLFASACGDDIVSSSPEAALRGPDQPLAMQALGLVYRKVETGSGTGTWTGSIQGDLLPVAGILHTQVYDLQIAGPVWHIKTYWTVDAGTRSFRADLEGTLNTITGRLVLNGTIFAGVLEGAQVHNEGELIEVLASGATVFEGTMAIMPASSD